MLSSGASYGFPELQQFGLHLLWSTALVYALVFTLLPPLLAPVARHPGPWALAIVGITNVGFQLGVTAGGMWQAAFFT
jgi:hypothetical protein